MRLPEELFERCRAELRLYLWHHLSCQFTRGGHKSTLHIGTRQRCGRALRDFFYDLPPCPEISLRLLTFVQSFPTLFQQLKKNLLQDIYPEVPGYGRISFLSKMEDLWQLMQDSLLTQAVIENRLGYSYHKRPSAETFLAEAKETLCSVWDQEAADFTPHLVQHRTPHPIILRRLVWSDLQRWIFDQPFTEDHFLVAGVKFVGLWYLDEYAVFRSHFLFSPEWYRTLEELLQQASWHQEGNEISVSLEEPLSLPLCAAETKNIHCRAVLRAVQDKKSTLRIGENSYVELQKQQYHRL